MHVLMCMITQEMAEMWGGGQKLISKNGAFQLRSAVYTSRRFPRFLLSLLSFSENCNPSTAGL